MLKLGCTLPNLANISLHKSTDANFYPFTEGDKDLVEKIRKDVVGGPSIVFPKDVHLHLNTFSKRQERENSPDMFNASLEYPKNWEPILVSSVQLQEHFS